MMDQLQELKNRLGTAQSVLFLIRENPSPDVVAASLAFYLSLVQAGKNASITAVSSPVVRDSHLVGLDKITTELGGDNLVITLNVPESAIDKVVSNTDGGHLNLIINPAVGQKPLTEKDVKFSYTGASADLVIVVGASDTSDFGALLSTSPDLFTPEKLVNISNQVGSFGGVNITDPGSSNSELTTALLKELMLPLDVDIATNLLQGIDAATDNLSSPSLTADTFEALAVLYRAGAKRIPTPPPTREAKIIADMPIVDNGSDADPEPDWLKPKIFSGKNT